MQPNAFGVTEIMVGAVASLRKLGTQLFRDPEIGKLSVSDFAKIIKEGKNNMPSFRMRLTDKEIRSLAKYVKELK